MNESNDKNQAPDASSEVQPDAGADDLTQSEAAATQGDAQWSEQRDEKDVDENDAAAATATADEGEQPHDDDNPGAMSQQDANVSVESGSDDLNGYDDNDGDSALVAAAAPAVAKAKTGRGIAWLALLLALAGVGGSGYLGYMLVQQQQRGQSLGSMAEQNHQQIRNFQRAIESAKNSVAEERAARQQTEARLAQALDKANASIDGHSRRLLSLTATTTDDWRLAEAEYLLRLANQRILTSKDGKTALNLLEAADQIFLELGDPRLFPVREAIANDKAALALVGNIDFDGVFLQLGALGGQINKLPLLQVPEFATVAIDASAGAAGDASVAVASNTVGEGSSEPTSNTPQWLTSLQEIARSTWGELKSLVVIQQRDANIKPLLPPEQQYYLRNNLRLLINQAQIALLDGRQVPYRESLASAEAWLQEHFPMQEPANQRVAKSLRELAGIPVSAEYPDVSASLLAIKAFIAEQHRLGQGAGKTS